MTAIVVLISPVAARRRASRSRAAAHDSQAVSSPRRPTRRAPPAAPASRGWPPPGSWAAGRFRARSARSPRYAAGSRTGRTGRSADPGDRSRECPCARAIRPSPNIHSPSSPRRSWDRCHWPGTGEAAVGLPRDRDRRGPGSRRGIGARDTSARCAAGGFCRAGRTDS